MGFSNFTELAGAPNELQTPIWIRTKTQTRIQIGQNGCIWIDGKGDDISLAQKAVEMINEEATSKGLTKKIEKLLEK